MFDIFRKWKKLKMVHIYKLKFSLQLVYCQDEKMQRITKFLYKDEILAINNFWSTRIYAVSLNKLDSLLQNLCSFNFVDSLV